MSSQGSGDSGAGSLADRLRFRLRGAATARGSAGTILLGIIPAIILGALIGVSASAYDAGDRVIAGNTAGTLSVLLEIDGQRILVGAGSTRSHAADFVGRSTRPWDRHIDLLILPGWDERHVTGAIGLLERHEVSGIAVLGLPGEDPLWTILERESQWRDVEIRFLDGDHRLALTPDATLTLLAGEWHGSDGALVRLDYHDTRIDIVDAERGIGDLIQASRDESGDAHVSILSRSPREPVETGSTVVLRPLPFLTQEFQAIDGEFLGEIPRNHRLVIRLAPSELRIPLDTLKHSGS
jgi:hypothetical protein